MKERTATIQNLLAKPKLNLRAADAVNRLGGVQMTTFASELIEAATSLPTVTSKMVTALARASAVASDLESADRSLFEQKLSQLRDLRELHEMTIKSASACRDQTAGFPRGSAIFNRGKRLAVAAIEENIAQLSLCAKAIEGAESELHKILRLF